MRENIIPEAERRFLEIWKSNPDNYTADGKLKSFVYDKTVTLVDFEKTLEGKTIIEIVGAEEDSECILFKLSDNSVYAMTPQIRCSEEVLVDDICGNIDDLIGLPITLARVDHDEDVCDDIDDDDYGDHYTWTFYQLATTKGYVTIKWYGESNGYYSEEAPLFYIGKEEV